MTGEFDKIDDLFRAIDDQGKSGEDTPQAGEQRSGAVSRRSLHSKADAAMKKVDGLFIDKSGSQKTNYTGDEPTERDYSPVRQSHEYRSGCLGGLMYFVFIACVSIVLACFAWMCASDMLALNKEDFSATVTLPMSVFKSETIDVFDENGNKTGTKRVTSADMDYVTDELKESGLIEYKWLFELFCKVSKADQKVSPGEYELDSSYDYRALIQHMRAGATGAVTVEVTIPEGFTMHQLFLRLEENGVCDYNSLMEAAAEDIYNYSFLDGVETVGARRLEGFLFPDTYEFYVGMQASSAIKKLLDTFYYKFDADMLSQAQTLDMSVEQVACIASLIEKEAANDEERAIIASVIYNRISQGMTLGIDASILYEYPDHEGAPTADMLASESPYNTRINLGLPPTPICNPGVASINAALHPDYSNYLFYALDTATGVHRFFTTEATFEAFVATQNYE